MTTIASELLPNESQTESYPSPPSLAISAHSLVKGTPQHIREWLMSSQEDFHVSHFPLPASEQGQTTQEICGLQHLTPYARLDPATASLKTFQASLLVDILSESYATLPKAGIASDGVVYLLPSWERRISEIGCGLLPTPVGYDATPGGPNNHYNGLGKMAERNMFPTPVVPNGGRQHNLDNITLDDSKVQMDLQTYVRLWPTPSAHKLTRSGEIVNADGTPWDGQQKPHSAATGKPIQTALTDAVARYPTPRASDANGHQIQPNKQGGLGLNQLLGGKLNPRWVEWLMDMPEGWLSCAPLEMLKWRQWLQQHGIY